MKKYSQIQLFPNPYMLPNAIMHASIQFRMIVQSSATITRCNIARYYINNYRNWGRISTRCWIHKSHPIPRPNGRAMRCLSWKFVRKLTVLKWLRTVLDKCYVFCSIAVAVVLCVCFLLIKFTYFCYIFQLYTMRGASLWFQSCLILLPLWYVNFGARSRYLGYG